jgi:hypothetical protein
MVGNEGHDRMTWQQREQWTTMVVAGTRAVLLLRCGVHGRVSPLQVVAICARHMGGMLVSPFYDHTDVLASSWPQGLLVFLETHKIHSEDPFPQLGLTRLDDVFLMPWFASQIELHSKVSEQAYGELSADNRKICQQIPQLCKRNSFVFLSSSIDAALSLGNGLNLVASHAWSSAVLLSKHALEPT